MPNIGTRKDWMAEIGFDEKPDDKLQSETGAENQEAAYNTEEIVPLMRQNLNVLAGLAMPEVFKVAFPNAMLLVWSLLIQNVTLIKKFPQLALGIPRGHGKTTLIKLFILYCILFTTKKFILVTAATENLATNIISDTFDMLSENNIIRLFGNWEDACEKNTAALKKFSFRGRVVIIAAIGVGGSVRGLNIKNERPDVIIFEDIQTREDAESKTVSEGIERWMIGTAMKAKSPHGCLFIFDGNMYPTPYSILKKLKTNSSWLKLISGAILSDGRAFWEELRSLESLVEELDNDILAGHPEIFFSEVLNDTEVGLNTSVDFSKFHDWKWGEDEVPQGKFIIIDPSTNKANSDMVGIGYFEVYDGTPALREVIEEALSPGNTIRKALYLALKTGTKTIVVEANAYQHSLLFWFDEIAKSLQLTGFNFVPIYSGQHSKNSRIHSTLKELMAGEQVLHHSTRAAVTNQISNWNPLKRDNIDNILDLLTYSKRIMMEFGALIATDYDLELKDYTSSVDVDACPSLF